MLVSGRARQLEAQRTELASIREIAAFRKKQLEALTIRAGVRGIVQDVPLENGQWVAIGTVLAKVAEPGQLKAEVRVSEAYVRDLQPGLGVRFEAVGSAPSTAGKIVRIDPAVVAGSVKLEVRLEGTPDGLRADQRVSGYVEIERIENVLHVARPAGLRDGATGGVFRLEPDGVHAVRVNVQLGRGSAREVEITAGLREGDSVVVSDVSAWDSVARVRLK